MEMKSGIKKNTILVCLIAALSVFWTGAGYINWLYGLLLHFSPQFIDITANIVDFLCQALGIAAIALYIRKHPDRLIKTFVFAIIAELVFMMLSVYVPIPVPKLILGFGMDIFCGMMIGGYITIIASFCESYGIVYGIACSVGGILSYLIMLPLEGRLYTGDLSYVVYFLIAAALIVMTIFIKADKDQIKPGNISNVDKKKSLLCAGFVLLTCITMNLGYMQPAADISGGDISLELARAFSALGMIIAAIIITRSRRSGLTLCVCSVINPFICMALTNASSLKMPLWILTYIFTGFYSIFFMVLFADVAREYGLWLAGLGMMFRRLGEVIGSGLGMLLAKNSVVLVIVNAILFVLTLFIGAELGRKLYDKPKQAENADTEALKSDDELFDDFAMKYGISDREKDVLRCVFDGSTNQEIAGALFISENTVKFHIKNILKKTENSNRAELKKTWYDFKQIK